MDVSQHAATIDGRVTSPWPLSGFKAAGQECGDRGSGSAAGVARLLSSFAARINPGQLNARSLDSQLNEGPVARSEGRSPARAQWL